MQPAIRTGGRTFSAQVMGARVLLVADVQDGPIANRLARCGSLVDTEETMELALRRLRDDPLGYDLFVMDCDSCGGVAGGERAVASLIAADARMRVMLVSAEFDAPALPLGRRTAVCLPAAVEDEEFRRGYDHVLRDKVPQAVM